MAYTPVTTGLYTTVQNKSGQTRVFGFLGTHGKRLNNNETYTVAGDLVAKLGAKRSTRQFKALERALSDGDLKIVSSPAVYLNDSTTDETRELTLAGGVLGTVDPQWDPAGTGTSDFVDNDGPVVESSSEGA
jgi:hypothetical protein